MTIADSLGMPIPSGTNVTLVTEEETPEDRMLLPIGVLYRPRGIWHTVYFHRAEVKDILERIRTGTEYEFIEGRSVSAIRICEVEGPECNMQFIYDYDEKTWRLE